MYAYSVFFCIFNAMIIFLTEAPTITPHENISSMPFVFTPPGDNTIATITNTTTRTIFIPNGFRFIVLLHSQYFVTQVKFSTFCCEGFQFDYVPVLNIHNSLYKTPHQ